MAEPPPAPTDSLARLAREWDELAEADALWAVLSTPDRKGGRWTVREFLAAGEQEIAEQLGRAHAIYGLPHSHGRALDFGCGAGRLVHALSPRFKRVVGIDVSATMIGHARRLTDGCDNVTVVVNTDRTLPFESGSFDFVYTSLVLQHVPTSEMVESYVRELVRVTAPQGIAVLQAPHTIPFAYRLQPLRRTYGLLRKLGVPAQRLILRTPLQPMRMTALPRERFEAAVLAVGGELLGIETDGAHGLRYTVTGPLHPGHFTNPSK